MIRPLPYCLTLEHTVSSLQTIDRRIEELMSLREEYLKKLREVTEGGIPIHSPEHIHTDE